MTLLNEEERLRELYRVNSPVMEQSRVIIGGYESKHSKDCLNLTMKSLRIIVRIFTVHCRLNYQVGELGTSVDPACRCYRERDETSIHLCKVYVEVLGRLLNTRCQADTLGSRSVVGRHNIVCPVDKRGWFDII